MIPKITRSELVSVHSNGIVLSCQGMFLGQLLVKMSRQADSIVVLQLASLPDLGFVVSAINGLIASHFQQCMFLFLLLFLHILPSVLLIGPRFFLMFCLADRGYTKEELCPGCVEHSILSPERIGTFCMDDKVSVHLQFPSF